MQVETVSDLFDRGTLSMGLLGEALRTGAPQASRWVSAVDTPWSPPQLQAAVADALPDALVISLRECIGLRWWPAQKGHGPWKAQLSWSLHPKLDWLHQGWPAIVLCITAQVDLEQADAKIVWSAADRRLTVGCDRTWLAVLKLSVADADGRTSPRHFYTRQAHAMLVPGAWQLPLRVVAARQAARPRPWPAHWQRG